MLLSVSCAIQVRLTSRDLAAVDDSLLLPLIAGGTGFAAHDKEKAEAERFWALGPGSGKQELRGQHRVWLRCCISCATLSLCKAAML